MKKAAKRAPPAARKVIVKSTASKSSVQSGQTVVVTAVAEAVEAAGSGQAKWSTSVSLESLRKRQDMFAKERDWDQHHTPRNLALAMVGEVDSFVASVIRYFFFSYFPICLPWHAMSYICISSLRETGLLS